MKTENIEMLIDALNAGQMADRIFRTKLAPTVEYARVWLNEPKGDIGNEGSCEFYFVLNDRWADCRRRVRYERFVCAE
jgi:hypothetical protein